MVRAGWSVYLFRLDRDGNLPDDIHLRYVSLHHIQIGRDGICLTISGYLLVDSRSKVPIRRQVAIQLV